MNSWTQRSQTLWAVYLREILERWQLLALAAFLLVLLPVLSLLPMGYGIDPAAARQAIGIGFGVGYFVLCSLILGLSLFASDQASGRAGFYLSRPIAPWQLLLARLAAALTLVFVGSLLVVLPAFADAPRGDLRELLGPTALAVAACLLLVTAGHLAAVSFRLRGVWTLLDLFAVVATLLLFIRTSQAALRLLFMDLAQQLPYLGGLAVLGAFVVALWVQLRHGGVARGRLHATFSIPFWLVVVGLLVVCRAWLAYTGDKGWQDVRKFEDFWPSQQGTAAWIVGDIGGAPRPFFVDLESPRLEPPRLEQPKLVELEPSVMMAEPNVAGRRLFWWPCVTELQVGHLLPSIFGGSRVPPAMTCHMTYLDLDADDPRPVETSFAAERDRLALSPDGERIAYLDGGNIDIFDVPSLRLVGRYDAEPVVSMIYVDAAGLVVRSHLEDYGPGGRGTRLTRLSWDGQPFETADLDGEIQHTQRHEGSLLLFSDGGVLGYDPSTLEPLERLPLRIEGSRQSRQVSTGHVAYLTDPGDRIRRRAPDGTELPAMPLPALSPASVSEDSNGGSQSSPYRRLGPELEPGRILVEASTRGLRQRSYWHLPWIGPAGAMGSPYYFTRSERSVVSYVDIASGEILATFEGYGVLPRTFGDDETTEAWLVDSRGLAHRFRPSAGLGEPTLEPLLSPPWAQDDE